MPLKTQDFNNNLRHISHKYRKKSRKICCLWSGFHLKLWTDLFPDQAAPSRNSDRIKSQQRCETNVRRVIVSRLLGAACSSSSCCVEAKTPTRTTSTDPVSACLSVPTLYLFLSSEISDTQNTAIATRASNYPFCHILLSSWASLRWYSHYLPPCSYILKPCWSVWTMLISVYLKTIHIYL